MSKKKSLATLAQSSVDTNQVNDVTSLIAAPIMIGFDVIVESSADPLEPSERITEAPAVSTLCLLEDPSPAIDGDQTVTIDEDIDELALAADVSKLWDAQCTSCADIRQTRQALAAVREELGAQLYNLKLVHAKPGRNGSWSNVLKTIGIPLATADRYVKKHEQRLAPDNTSLLSEEIEEPSPARITAMVKKLLPGLSKFLNTPAVRTAFLSELAHALETKIA